MYSRRLKLGKRIVARILAAICLWLSAGVVLDHTDDLRPLLPFHGGALGIHHAHPAPPLEPCAACEWIQAAGTLQTPSVSVARAVSTILDRPLAPPDALHLTPFTHILFRGPPALSA